ncbi:MAG TPA: integrin alpha [Solirubrobacteraceae bacterium]
MRRLAILGALAALLLVAASPASANLVRRYQTGAITVADSGSPPTAGSPYPSKIGLTGIAGQVTGVTVRLNDVSHTSPDDMDVLLVGPSGRSVLLMSDAGGFQDATGADLTFDDGADGPIPDASVLSTGTYRPTNYEDTPDAFPAPAPGTVPSPTLADAFDGTDPNGEWKLYAVDDAASDSGEIAGGWTLTLRTGHVAANPDEIGIADAAPAAPYPSEILVNDLSGVIADVNVRLNGFTHDDTGDVDVLLESPSRATTVLMSDAGGVSDAADLDLRFDDDAPGTLDDVSPLKDGSYKPANLQGTDDAFPAPAPAQDGTASLAALEGTNANGLWRLYVVDDSANGGGKLAGGWSLSITMRSGVRIETKTFGEGDGTQTVVVERPEGGGAAQIQYQLPDAAHAKDVAPKSGKLNFAFGQKKANLPVTIVDDSGDEGLEAAEILLKQVSGDVSTPADGTFGYLQIEDNDQTDVRDDFNGDGRADQAIGVPNEDLPGGADAGAVQVLYGSDNGLQAGNDQRFTQDAAGMPDVAEPGDQFGAAVAASDFDGDGFGDLAIGAPGEDDAGVTDMGRVTILYGSATGLKTSGALLLGQGSTGVPDDNETGDRWGAALAAGNLGRGARGDLAVGAPGEDVGAITGAGAVTTLYGTASGLGTSGSTLWTQNTANVEQDAEAGDGFGSVLAVGDFGKGAESDLAVGVPAENAGRGVVQVLYGTTATGISASGDSLFSQSTPGMGTGSIAEDGDHFGAALATGDMGGRGGGDELAIGAPDENVNGVADAGAAHVLQGTDAGGLTTDRSEYWVQNDPKINTINEPADRFGAAVVIGDFGGDGDEQTRAAIIHPFDAGSNDLAVGVPGETFGAIKGAGAVEVIYGHEVIGNDIPNAQWHQDDTGIADTNKAGDHFGATLARGAYEGAFGSDGLAIGVPGEKLGTAAGAGGVAVLSATTTSGIVETDSQRFTQGAGGVQDTAEAGDGFGAVLSP